MRKAFKGLNGSCWLLFILKKERAMRRTGKLSGRQKPLVYNFKACVTAYVNLIILTQMSTDYHEITTSIRLPYVKLFYLTLR